jgi:hypothetical protein
MKYGMYLHLVTLHTCECLKIWCTERHTFLKSINEILPIFPIFLPICIEFRVEGFSLTPLINCESRENWCGGSLTLVKGVNEFLSVLSTFII